jgi:hypothetical protein
MCKLCRLSRLYAAVTSLALPALPRQPDLAWASGCLDELPLTLILLASTSTCSHVLPIPRSNNVSASLLVGMDDGSRLTAAG